jgi:hypothetical protein
MKIPNDVKDIKAIREFLTTIRTQVCGMAAYLLPARESRQRIATWDEVNSLGWRA